MTSTYLFGANDRRSVDDVRPAVYESCGLQIHNGNDEWIWRPLPNPETLQISAFVDPAPKGFGLIQRDRDYTPSWTTTRTSSVGPACGSSRSAIGATVWCS